MLNLIDTRMGTANQFEYSNGNTLPLTGYPFGMNFFAPQTSNTRGSWWFHPDDRTFQGYRLTHQPSPWMGDFQHFIMTPVCGQLNFKNQSLFNMRSSYRPEETAFKPHSLKVKQLRYNITSELVPSTYGAMLKINYPNQDENGLFLYAEGGFHDMTLDDSRTELSGYISNFAGSKDSDFKMYITFKFSTPLMTNALELSDDNQALLLQFSDSDEVLVKLATSFINVTQAQLNLETDVSLSFDEQKEKTAEKWHHYLNKIEVNHHNEEELKTFYNCLYRMFLFPQKFYELDADGLPIHYDTTSQSVHKGYLYTNNGFWDAFRTVYPLYSIIPEFRSCEKESSPRIL